MNKYITIVIYLFFKKLLLLVLTLAWLCACVSFVLNCVTLQVDKSPEGQFVQLMALPRTLQQRITKLVDPPGKNRDVEEILLQVAQDPECGAVVQQGKNK